MQKPKDFPKELLFWDMDHVEKRWDSDDDSEITLTPENINRIWRKQNEIIAFLKARLEAPDAKG